MPRSLAGRGCAASSGNWGPEVLSVGKEEDAELLRSLLGRGRREREALSEGMKAAEAAGAFKNPGELCREGQCPREERARVLRAETPKGRSKPQQQPAQKRAWPCRLLGVASAADPASAAPRRRRKWAWLCATGQSGVLQQDKGRGLGLQWAWSHQRLVDYSKPGAWPPQRGAMNPPRREGRGLNLHRGVATEEGRGDHRKAGAWPPQRGESHAEGPGPAPAVGRGYRIGGVATGGAWPPRVLGARGCRGASTSSLTAGALQPAPGPLCAAVPAASQRSQLESPLPSGFPTV